MKTALGMAILAVGLLGAAVAQTEVATVEAQVTDTAGNVLAAGGPWVWGPDAYGLVEEVPAGNGLILLVWCRDQFGRLLFTGRMEEVLVPPSTPYGDTGFLALYAWGADIYALASGFVDLGPVELVPVEDGEREVAVDIKPGSATNPFNVTSRGVLPVVILGGPDLDVRAIDVASLTLAGVRPEKYAVADVERATDRALVRDGYADLVLHFKTQSLVSVLGPVENREVLGLVLTGQLVDGTGIRGVDTITVLGVKKPAPKPKASR